MKARNRVKTTLRLREMLLSGFSCRLAARLRTRPTFCWVERELVKIVILIVLSASIGFCKPVSEEVEFSVPSTWHKMGNMPDRVTDTLCVYSYYLRTEKINGKEHYANALLQYYRVPDTVNIEYADGIVAYHIKDAVYIVSAIDGEKWKTYLLTVDIDKVQYIVLYGVGIDKGICAELMLVFPHNSNKIANNKKLMTLTLEPDFVKDDRMGGIYCNRVSLKPYVDEFNQVCDKLKINGTNIFRAKAVFVNAPRDAEVFRDTMISK